VVRFGTNRRGLIRIAGAAGLGAMLPWAAGQPQERTVAIVARKFEFEPASITVKVGEPVVLELTAPDVIMGFNLDAFGMRTDVVPGKVTRLRLTPDRVGVFGFRCDVFCGDGHEEMDGSLTVTE
jgi:cytochrome c oxidase subunit II